MAELNGEPIADGQLKSLALGNYGHFTSMTVVRGAVRGLALHMDRLARDSAALFGTALDVERVQALVAKATSHRSEVISVRVTVFDKNFDLGQPGANATPSVLVTTRPIQDVDPPALRVKSSPYLRDLPTVKHVGLFGQLHLRRQAQVDGYDDVLFTTPEGDVTEGATWNVGFIDGNSIVWPDADVLPGITQALVEKSAHCSSRTHRVRLSEINGMDAAFATNSSVGVRPIAAINQTRWPDNHATLAKLRELYEAVPGEAL